MGLIGRLAVGVLLLAAGAIGYTIYQSSKPPEGSVGEFLKRPRPAGKRVAVIFGAGVNVGQDCLPAGPQRACDFGHGRTDTEACASEQQTARSQEAVVAGSAVISPTAL